MWRLANADENIAMDIKGLARNVIPLNVKSARETKTLSTQDSAADRDGNGQASSGEDQRKRNLSPEEITDAVKYLEGLAGVKDNNLKVRVEAKDGITTIYIEDRDGKIVRRIPESELGFLTSNRQKTSGHLLNKAL